MKRITVFLLILVTVFSLVACNANPEPILQPVNFYYRNSEVTYGAPDGLISAQVTESAGFGGNTLAILNAYVRGPSKEIHRHTFPTGTQIYQIDLIGGKAYIQMNNTFARLSGIELTLACACLTMTTIELTGAESVTISTQSVTLDGSASITMDEQSFLFYSNPTE